MNAAEVAAWLNLPDGQEPGQEVITALADIPVPRTDAEQLAAFRAYLSAIPLAPGAVMTGEVNRRGPEVEWSPAEAGAAVAAAIAEVGAAPGLWSPPDSGACCGCSAGEQCSCVCHRKPKPQETDSPGATVFHSPFCTCGHKQTLHAGADSDGRCVKRSCGCGRFTLSPRRQR